MSMAVRQGILQSFSATDWTASVLLIEATSLALSGVPCSTALNASNAIAGAFCAVLFFDEQDYTNAVVLACYPNGSGTLPSGGAGTITYITPHQFMNNVTINNGTTNTVTVAGVGGVPSGATGVLLNAWFSDPASTNSYVVFGPHSGIGSGNYPTIGNADNVGIITNGAFIVPLSGGQMDVKSVNDNNSVSCYAYGYTS